MGSLQTVLPFKLAATDEVLTAHGGLALVDEYVRRAKRTSEIAKRLEAGGVTPLETMLTAMRAHHAAGELDKAAAIARDAAPYMHPRLTSVDVGGRPGAPIETKDVTNEELARRIAFILGQAAREQAEETPLAASVASNGHQYGRQLADGEIA